MSRKPITIIAISLLLLIGVVAFQFLFSNFYFLYSSPSAEAAATRSGLVGWWTMDANDINGTTYYDKSSFHTNATAVGSPTIIDGKIKQSFSINAGTDYLNAGDVSFLDGLPNATFSLWIRPTNLNISRTLLDKWDTNQSSFLIRTQNSASDEIYVFIANALSDGGSNYFSTSNLDLLNNIWAHLTIVYDGSLAAANRVAVYKNGATVSGSITGTIATSMTSGGTAPLKIGDNTVASLMGAYDDVRIYNRALSAQEVGQLYASAKVSYTSAPQRASSTPSSGGKLVGWWTMETSDMSANGATIYDKSGLGNNGTVTGTTTSTGKIGQARSFNGTSNYVTKTNPTFIDDQQGTVSFWVKHNTLTEQTPFSITMPGSFSDEWVLDMGTRVDIFTYNDTANDFWLNTPANSVRANQWHHIVATSNGSTMAVYIDGDSKLLSMNVGTNQGQWFGDAVDVTAVNFGALNRASLIQPFSGSLDDVRIYNYALSAQDVANLYNSAKQSYVGATVRRTGLTLDLNFGNNDAQSAPKVFDTSGFNRHATSTAGATSPTCNGKFCDFDGGDYMMAVAPPPFNTNLSTASWAIKFSPDFSASDGIDHWFFRADGANIGSYLLKAGSDNGLYVAMGNNQLTGIPLATYGPYWKVGKENILVFSGVSANNNVWLNGVKIMDGNTSGWTTDAAPMLVFGTYTTQTAPSFDGRIHYFKVWNRLLTDAEVNIISADRQGYVR